MKKLKVYLSGAVKTVDIDFQTWRDKCLEIEKSGFYPDIKFVDPLNYFNYTSRQPLTNKQCIDFFIWLVEKSDILLINLDNSDKSIGAAMEVEHAFCNNIPIIAFGKNRDTWYNWLVERATVIFRNLEDAIEYLNDTYANI